MKNALLIAFGVVAVLLGLSNFAHAGFALGIGTENYRLELYDGQAYTYSVSPYTYIYDGFYYFDYPFRASYLGNYYYYPLGWYSFGNYWAPGCTSCYDYYPANYYYYNSIWTYSPGWVYSYGPAYYNHYYYPPQQPSLVGQEYKPAQEASCSEIEIVAGNVSLVAGETKKQTFYINNYSGKFFDVHSASVYMDSFAVGAKNVKHSATIENDSYGAIDFEAVAAQDAENGAADAKVNVSGAFRDGTNCSLKDIEARFSVSVSGRKHKANTYNDAYTYLDSSATGGKQGIKPQGKAAYSGTGAGLQTIGSESYFRAKEGQQSWKDVVPNGNAQTPSGNYVGSGMQSNAIAYAGNSNQSYNNSAQNTVANLSAAMPTITAPYGEKQLAAQDCSGIIIKAKNISVKQGEEAKEYFVLKNYSTEDFLVDSISVPDNGSAALVSAYREQPRIYAGETGALTVKVFAAGAERDSVQSSYVAIKGHFASGLKCEALSDNFLVKVNAEDADAIDKIKLSAPAKVEFAGNAGFVEFDFENPGSTDAEVLVRASGAKAGPSEIVLPAFSSGKRAVAVNGFDGQEAKVFFKVTMNGATVFEKYTNLTKPKQRPVVDGDGPGNAASNGNAGTTGKGPDANASAGILGRINNLAGAGFAVISGSAFYTGISLLLIIFFAWVAYRVATK